MMQQSIGQATPLEVLGHQDHADPGEAPAERQHDGAGDQPSFGLQKAETFAQVEHQSPVGGRLVPARFLRQRHGFGDVCLGETVKFNAVGNGLSLPI